MSKKYISNKDETVRMFESDFLETLSKVHWTVPLIIYLPVIGLLIYKSLTERLGFSQIFTLFFLGIVVWTFTEYALHRFIFHYQLKSEIGKRLHFILHGVHHDYPKDSRRLVMPPSVSIPLALFFYFLFISLLGHTFILPFFAGFLTGYLFYDTNHYAIHHFNMHGKIWLAIKNHHMKHHYQNPELGYGVSQPAWDYIFGTTFREKEESDL
jgi:sterol desaturase/sphingolipid hydroxylase (fatty acid hydroxylase superfamily)